MSVDYVALRESLSSIGIDRMRVMARDLYGVRSPSKILGGKVALVEAIVAAVQERNPTSTTEQAVSLSPKVDVISPKRELKQELKKEVSELEVLQGQVAALTRQVKRLSQRLQETVLLSISAWEVTQQDVDLLRLKVLPNVLYNDPGVRVARKHEVHKMWFKLRTGEELEDSMVQFSFKDQDMDILCADGSTITTVDAKVAHNKALSDAKKRT